MIIQLSLKKLLVGFHQMGVATIIGGIAQAFLNIGSYKTGIIMSAMGCLLFVAGTIKT